MPRKLTTLLCTLLLALLCACQSEPDTAIFCERHYDDDWHVQVVELDTDGSKRLLSDWKLPRNSERQDIFWAGPYLFRILENNDGWQVTSTAPDGSDERLWLDSSQLPEAYSGHRVRWHTVRFADDTLYLLCHNQLKNWMFVVKEADAPPRFLPQEDMSIPNGTEVWNGSYYLDMTGSLDLMRLDSVTGVCTAVGTELLRGIDITGLFCVDNGVLWYTTNDYEAGTTTLIGVDLETGSVRVQQEVGFRFGDGHLTTDNMTIHDGYLYCFFREGDGRYTLWEVPLTGFLKGKAAWESLPLDDDTAKHIASNLGFPDVNYRLNFCFGRKGLWLCYPMSDFGYGYTPGEIRYVPYGH